MGAQGKGLQVQKNHKANGLIPLLTDELVINVGDMLSRHA
jgi:isopenicillin N synthase-like dioxygenase